MVDEKFRNLTSMKQTNTFHLRRATRIKDDTSVVVCSLTKNNLSKSDLTRFLKEYETIRALDHPGVVQTLDVFDTKNEVILELEDFKCQCLSDLIKTTRPDLPECLNMALALADTLEYIHARNMYHGNLNGHSILVSPGLDRVKVTEFGIDLLVTGARTAMYDTAYIDNYLPYMAPEQTGRVNRSEEYRSDFYSLGVVLYHIITGTLPFLSSDPLELIHCHIAREPEPPGDMADTIPSTVWDILAKLMSKSPEERYQSAAGLKKDLLECQKRIQASGDFVPFEIGTKDIPDKFLVPLKLYGRETEVSQLLDNFNEVCTGTNRLLLVTGESGIGKSALVHEIHKPVLAHRGYFISGKYEQYKSDSPYSAIIQAFKGLIHQLLSQKEKTLALWRDNFKEILGSNGGVITDIFPELELVVGKQPPPPPVGPEESRNRFNMCFESFASLFVTGQRPLVLFLDDLQWVDFPSISLLTSLLFSLDTKYLYIIFSYRNNEVSDAHPFMEMINNIMNQGQQPETITLGPLSNILVRDLIVDFLKCTPEQGKSLGDQIFKKTAGNPFFVNQFLKTLYDKGIIVHDPDKGWTWDDRDIMSMQVTTNVLTLMTDNISALPENTRETLNVSSCIGNHFDPELLSMVMDKSLYDVLTDLKIAIDEGYLRHDGTMFKYNHDRIHEAAYALINDNEKTNLHLKIGQILLRQAEDLQSLENQLFYITDQLNLGAELIDRINARETLIEMNMKSGKKAKESAAFDPALKYYIKAENLLNEECRAHFANHLPDLFREIADAACLIGNYEQMDTYLTKAKALNPPTVQLAPVFGIEIRSHFARQDYQYSINTSKQILAELGVVFPEKVTKKHIIRELVKVKLKLRGKDEKGLLSLPFMTDEHQLAIAKIYYEMGISATLTDNILYGYIVLKRFAQVLEHGQHPYSGLCFLGYGALLTTALGKIEEGIRFADLALKTVERPECKIAKHKVHVIYVALISQWNYSIPKCKAFAENAYQLSREAGDQIYTALALVYRDFMAFTMSNNLNELVERMGKRIKITEQSGQRPLILFHKMIHQMIHNLIGTELMHHTKGDIFDCDVIIPEWYETENHTGLGFYHLILVRNAYQFCDYEQTHEYLTEIKKHWKEIQNMMAGQYLTYYDCLNNLALYPSLTVKEKRKILNTTRKTLKKLAQWDRMEPTKHSPWIYLIKAEQANILGNHTDAPVFYAKAIEAFEKEAFHIYLSMAVERAGIYYKNRGLAQEAGSYLTRAMGIVKGMGMTMIEVKFRELFPDDIVEDAYVQTGEAGKPHEASLDLGTIIKSSQALSGEIVLDKLMHTIMTISLESAGAQRGLLILPRENHMVVEMESLLDRERGGGAEPSVPLEQRDDLPLSVVNYVVRTLTPVVLGNACTDGEFTSDHYISRNKIKSLLAAPMVGSGKLKGIIYLENNLSSHVFSEDRIRILDVLASQAAISLENARLFDTVMKAEADLRTINLELEDRVEQRTRELKEAYEQIMGSIRYAGVIQHSLLPSTREIKRFLPESFFIWKPRDIVGGDIFTCDRVENGILISVIDCTGHGVPGAFMTMLAGSAMRRIIREEQIHQPAEILERLNRIIKALLHQDKSGTLSDDGLDAGICFYQNEKKTLHFAGAGIPLISVNGKGLDIIKGDRQSIGYVSSDTDYSYTTHTVEDIGPDKTFYLASDGFSDQLGGPENRRFGSKCFKDILLENHVETFDQQKEILIRLLENHKGEKEQTDDVTVAGFRFD